MVRLQLVTHIDQVKQNLQQYNSELQNGQMSLNTNGVQQWYYIHELDLFGPSRYIGYADVTIKKHERAFSLSGGKTTQALNKWFKRCDDPELYDKIADKLIDHLSQFNMDVRRDGKTRQPSFKLNLLKEEVSKLEEIYLNSNIQKDLITEQTELSMDEKQKERKVLSLSPEEIKSRALLASEANGNLANNMGSGSNSSGGITKTHCRVVSTTVYDRDPYIAQYVKGLAAGKCQLCEQPAPFKDTFGNPFLESHHIHWLAQGGKDTIRNCIALCSNCHRKIHILDLHKDVEKLKTIAAAYVLN